MNFSPSNNLPSYFWIVSTTALIWYVFGVYSYLMHVFLTSKELNLISNNDQNLYSQLPAWYISIFGIALFAGLLGSISLLIRKRWAYIVFTISFFACGIQQFYVLTEINPRDIFISLSSLVIAVFLVWFSKRASARGWLK